MVDVLEEEGLSMVICSTDKVRMSSVRRPTMTAWEFDQT